MHRNFPLTFSSIKSSTYLQKFHLYKLDHRICYANSTLMQKINKLPDYIKLNDAVRPQDDFYAYACQHWCQANPLPETEACWGTFHALRDKVDKQIGAIINDWLDPKTSLTPAQEQVVTYYQALVNKDKNQFQSQQTLQKIQAEIRQTGQEKSVEILAKLGKWQTWGFFRLGVNIDNKNNRRFLLSVKPPDLDLPNRDYYLSDNKRMQESRQAYLDFLETHGHILRRARARQPIEATRNFGNRNSFSQVDLAD